MKKFLYLFLAALVGNTSHAAQNNTNSPVSQNYSHLLNPESQNSAQLNQSQPQSVMVNGVKYVPQTENIQQVQNIPVHQPQQRVTRNIPIAGGQLTPDMIASIKDFGIQNNYHSADKSRSLAKKITLISAGVFMGLLTSQLLSLSTTTISIAAALESLNKGNLPGALFFGTTTLLGLSMLPITTLGGAAFYIQGITAPTAIVATPFWMYYARKCNRLENNCYHDLKNQFKTAMSVKKKKTMVSLLKSSN
jgi:hypothetical protein